MFENSILLSSRPSLTTSNPQLVSNLKNIMDESSVPPTTSPPSADSPTITVLSDHLSQKEMETLHSSLDSRSPLTVAATICKNPSILESVPKVIQNGIEEECKKLCPKTNGTILGYKNYQAMSKFSIGKLWMNLFLSSHFWLKL